jgi:hypothetical protein
MKEFQGIRLTIPASSRRQLFRVFVVEELEVALHAWTQIIVVTFFQTSKSILYSRPPLRVKTEADLEQGKMNVTGHDV